MRGSEMEEEEEATNYEEYNCKLLRFLILSLTRGICPFYFGCVKWVDSVGDCLYIPLILGLGQRVVNPLN